MPFVIDVDPVAFTLFGVLPVRWYGLILLVSAAVAVWLSRREAHRRGFQDAAIMDAVWWVSIAALVGGRALYVVQNELPTLADHPAHVLMVWMGGLSFYGGLIGGLLALLVFARRRGLPLLVTLEERLDSSLWVNHEGRCYPLAPVPAEPRTLRVRDLHRPCPPTPDLGRHRRSCATLGYPRICSRSTSKEWMSAAPPPARPVHDPRRCPAPDGRRAAR